MATGHMTKDTELFFIYYTLWPICHLAKYLFLIYSEKNCTSMSHFRWNAPITGSFGIFHMKNNLFYFSRIGWQESSRKKLGLEEQFFENLLWSLPSLLLGLCQHWQSKS